MSGLVYTIIQEAFLTSLLKKQEHPILELLRSLSRPQSMRLLSHLSFHPKPFLTAFHLQKATSMQFHTQFGHLDRSSFQGKYMLLNSEMGTVLGDTLQPQNLTKHNFLSRGLRCTLLRLELT